MKYILDDIFSVKIFLPSIPDLLPFLVISVCILLVVLSLVVLLVSTFVFPFLLPFYVSGVSLYTITCYLLFFHCCLFALFLGQLFALVSEVL